MFKLNKNIKFEVFMKEVVEKFNSFNVLSDISTRCSISIEARTDDKGVIDHDKAFLDATQNLIIMAACKTMCKEVIYDKPVSDIYNGLCSTIADRLSFTTLQEAKDTLLKVSCLEEDITFNLLEYAFYALVLLDDDIHRRFKDAYILWQNSCDVGFAGFETLQGEQVGISTYLTFYSRRAFYIDPVKGEIYSFKRKKGLYNKDYIGFRHVDVDGVKKICMECTDGSLVPLIEYDMCGIPQLVHEIYETKSDMKASERKRKREEGLEVKETPWLSVSLGEMEGTEHNIRIHSLICLMVYGLEVMKYGIMEGNSIFTIDHMDGVHDNNKIANLQCLTRKSNDMKKENTVLWVFDYFTYWVKCIGACKKVQAVYEYRACIAD